ncbi:hypothetical protein OIU84_024736 [Salix udensis]|uniref:Uncharacterized protein n=1 Tax=Salix udensis TaxID=889485 RepID=A0AAD6PCA6_9ROSI|nr:hypothetical protein OIU84_024736 [Salix udensis]
MSTLTRPEPFSRPAARTSSSLSGGRNRQFHHYLTKRSPRETMKKPTKIQVEKKRKLSPDWQIARSGERSSNLVRTKNTTPIFLFPFLEAPENPEQNHRGFQC